MNRQDAAWLLATLAAPYPGEPFTDDAAEVWYNSTLHDLDIDAGMEVVERLIASEEFRPTPAVFNRELRTARHHQAIAAAGVPALEAPRTSTHPAAEVIEELRRKIATDGPRAHWHAGPDPCEVCGGMQQFKSRRAPKQPLAKERCSRCGQNTMPHCDTIEPKEVAPMILHPEQIDQEFKTPAGINRAYRGSAE